MRRDSVHRATISDLRDPAGTLQTNSDVVVKVKVTAADGSSLLAATTMTYDSAGQWHYDIPAANFPSASAPWTVQVLVYDSGGTTLRATFTLTGADEWWS